MKIINRTNQNLYWAAFLALLRQGARYRRHKDPFAGRGCELIHPGQEHSASITIDGLAKEHGFIIQVGNTEHEAKAKFPPKRVSTNWGGTVLIVPNPGDGYELVEIWDQTKQYI